MKWLRRCISLLLLTAGLLASAAWAASYFWWPQMGFPWPTSGLGQSHDRGFLLLIDGRLFVVRQNVDWSPKPQDSGQTLPVISLDVPPSLSSDFNGFSIDSRTLGTMKIVGGTVPAGNPVGPDGRAIGTVTVSAVEQGLAKRSWHRLGFMSGPLRPPRIAVNDAMATARWTATAVPLWLLVFAILPGLVLLYRGRRSRRWAEEGRCPACGYDLRESPERCPECGLPQRYPHSPR